MEDRNHRHRARRNCESCWKAFTPSKNAAGKFCSHACDVAYKTGRKIEAFKTPASDKSQRLRANGLINMRLRRGWFKKPADCMKCGRTAKLDSHHADYSKPDEVYWLCRSCHMQAHYRPSILDALSPMIASDQRTPKPLPVPQLGEVA